MTPTDPEPDAAPASRATIAVLLAGITLALAAIVLLLLAPAVSAGPLR